MTHKIEHNATTGEITKLEMTVEELAELEADKVRAAERKAAQAAAEAEAETAKATATAKLAALGLTEDDLKALGL